MVNRMAAAEILAMGMRRVTLAPEDSLANMRSLLAELGDRAAVLVYQDVPLFISETCVRASLRGACPGAARCDFTETALVSSSGERVRAINRRCRSVTIGEAPFSIAHRARELAAWGATRLRADFVWRAYAPEDVRERWRALRGGARLPGTHEGNAK
ncbi:MAG TPA: hypothetical protein DCM87_11785 [Planctomycetes bacterium]|nr:hypothetical protein [Planctomycetota bacterium]